MPIDPHVGLCSICNHARLVLSGRGSLFYLCSRAAEDPRFRKYPSLPVQHCPGFEPGEPAMPPRSPR